MTMQVFISGHGSWEPENGYVMVPKGMKVHFYTHFAKTLVTGMEYKILSGEYETKDRTINEFKTCPNLQISYQKPEWTRKSIEILKTRNGNCWSFMTPPEGIWTLETFFDVWKGSGGDENPEFHWLACQALDLKNVGGKEFGLNAADFSHLPSKPGRFRVTTLGPNGLVTTWV